MSIGSISPNGNVNCIKDVMFRNINFDMPMKAIYIKSNPLDPTVAVQSAIIQNITYENIVMKYPVWWGIYIGPQQMKEPNGDGPGCMLYPLTACETDPLVSMIDITLRNVTSYGSILPAGIIRCNSSNPCKNFVFEDVQLTSPIWDALEMGFISEFVEGTVTRVHPDPKFKPIGYYDDPENRKENIINHMSMPEFMVAFLFKVMKAADPIETIQ